jgi:lipopolysaccharide heptosyltransferase II
LIEARRRQIYAAAALHRMLDFSIYLLFRAGTAAIGALPLKLLFRVGNVIGLLAWIALPNYRALAQRNVRIAFGAEMSPRKQRGLVRRHFQRLGANLLCSVKMSSMPLSAVRQYVELGDVEPAEIERRAGHSAVVVLSHIGNWEALAQLLPSTFEGVPMGTVYQRLRNRRIDEHIRRQRGRAGVQLFDRREGFGKPAELLRNRGGIGVLADQHAGDHGIWTPFFGRLASTTTLPALLAKRTGASVLAASVQTIGIGRWRMTFTPRIDSADDSVESLTAKTNTVIEQQIRASPEDWFWVHNRWKTPHPNFLLSRYKRGVYLPPELPREKLQPFRILIRATNWLGDSVITMPAVRAIKNGRPDAHVTVAVCEKIAAVWRLVPEVDQVIVLRSKSVFAVSRAIRQQPRFDVAIVFPKSLRSALEVWLARIPRRVGFRGHRRSWLLTQIVPAESRARPVEHQVHEYLRFAKSLGASDPGVELHPPPWPVNGTAIRVGLCPGAEYGPAKRWLPDRFAQAAAAVSASRPVEWVLFGTKLDEAIGETIAAALNGNCTNLIGKTTLDELIEHLRGCSALLTNDTGTMHLATLLGVPVVAVFGSTEPRLTGPLGDEAMVIRHHVECSPCFLRECPIDFRCMHAVRADEVADALLVILSEVDGQAARESSTSRGMTG